VPGLYPVLGLLFGAAPRLLCRVPLRALAGVALATAVVAVAGIVLGFRPYPFTDAVVAAFCITAGTSIGRAVPPQSRQPDVDRSGERRSEKLNDPTRHQARCRPDQETAGNIMATIITTHVTRNSPAPSMAIPPMPAIEAAC
jgi:hypothetical protein